MELLQNSRFKTAVFVVVYPGCEPFFADFASSILSQTYQNFDLIVVDDGCQFDWSNKLRYRVHKIKGTGNIAQNRELGLRTAQESGYEYVILCDFDDYFHQNRFEKIIDYLEVYDCVVHDLSIVTNDGDLLSKDYFQQSHDIPNILPKEFLDDKNICGFSNCGINLRNIKIPTINLEIHIVDWFLFSVLLESGVRIGFLPESLTYYRQHNDNLIGIEDFTLESFRKLLPMKIMHYSFMKGINERYCRLYDKYHDMLDVSDSEIMKSIIKNKAQIQHPLWWENIRL